jgi:hypothetical protein
MPTSQLPSNFLHWLLALPPIVVLLVLLVWRHWRGIEAGPAAMLTAALIALLVFRTPIRTLAVAAGKGVWDAVFIQYVVWAALLLYLVTLRSGAFDALRRGFLAFSRNELFLVLAIGWVFASFFQGVAGFDAPIAVAAPLLIGIGVRPVDAILVPLIAHTWAKMYGMLGGTGYAARDGGRRSADDGPSVGGAAGHRQPYRRPGAGVRGEAPQVAQVGIDRVTRAILEPYVGPVEVNQHPQRRQRHLSLQPHR